MPIGTIGQTFEQTITRDELISIAYRDIKVLAEGETLSADLLKTGIQKLNLIIREHDVAGKHLWAIDSTPTTLTLIANTYLYSRDSGLPATILSLVEASYRTTSGDDSPLKILTTEQYEGLSNKADVGDPTSVYLTEHRLTGSKLLYVFPSLSTVADQSVVTGTDGEDYKCILSHDADSTTTPVTGANYRPYWQLGGTSPGTWTTGTSYTAPQHLRLWFKRPLYNFDEADDNPDMPAAWSRWLIRELAIDLSPGHNRTVDDVNLMRSLRNESYEKVFRSVQPNTTEVHNKVQYF